MTTPESEAKLEASIDRLGFFRPVVVREIDGELQIIGGEHRWEIAKRRGIQVPIINLGPIADQKAKEISIADNVRYGADDALSFAEFIKEMSNSDELQVFLPFTDRDFEDLFASTDIALEDLGIEENFDAALGNDDTGLSPKAAKTHTIMRFKVSLKDAEKITGLIASTQKLHGLTESDALTNAGDALTHLLVTANAKSETPPFSLDEFEDGLSTVEFES